MSEELCVGRKWLMVCGAILTSFMESRSVRIYIYFSDNNFLRYFEMAWQKKMTLVDFQYMIDACRENPALVPGDEREDAVCNCKDGSDEPPGSCMDIESIISQFKRALQHCEDGGGGDIFFQIFTGGVLIGAGIAGGYWLYK